MVVIWDIFSLMRIKTKVLIITEGKFPEMSYPALSVL
jgi:hypothetical protein